jgi:hypothetical protein
MDLIYALQRGEPMVYFRDCQPDIHSELASKGLDTVAVFSTPNHKLDPGLYRILLDTIDFTNLLNSITSGTTLDLEMFQEAKTSICSRLVRFHPFQSTKQMSVIEAAYHIGLTIYMMTLFLQFDGRRLLQFDLVSKQLKKVLNGHIAEVDVELALWLAFVGSIWLASELDGLWLLSMARNLARRLQIENWTDAHRIISKFPWLHTLHSPQGLILWNKMHQDIP